jgi:hypothetical protein
VRAAGISGSAPESVPVTSSVVQAGPPDLQLIAKSLNKEKSMTSTTKARRRSKTEIQPLGDRVVVRPLEEAEEMRGGLYIPDTAKEKPAWATRKSSSSRNQTSSRWSSEEER